MKQPRLDPPTIDVQPTDPPDPGVSLPKPKISTPLDVQPTDPPDPGVSLPKPKS